MVVGGLVVDGIVDVEAVVVVPEEETVKLEEKEEPAGEDGEIVQFPSWHTPSTAEVRARAAHTLCVTAVAPYAGALLVAVLGAAYAVRREDGVVYACAFITGSIRAVFPRGGVSK